MLPRADARLAAVSGTLDHAAVRRVIDAAARKGVRLEVTAFPTSTHTAEQAAQAVDATLGQIVKSLVFVSHRQDGTAEPILCLVSGSNRVDVALLAAVIGRSDVRRATAKEANELTGFVIGGIPPFGHDHRIRVVMDPDLGRYATIWAAAGLPSAVFPISPASLRMLADAEVAAIAASPEDHPSAASAAS